MRFGANPNPSYEKTVTGVEHAVRFIRDTRWEDLPEEVRHQAKRALLDTLGALIAGAQTPAGVILRGYSLAQHPGDEATLLPTGERVSTVGAAM